MRNICFLSFFICLLVILGACSVMPVHLYDGPERPIGELATVKAFGPYLNVMSVDGKPVKPFGRVDRIHLLPGEHTFSLKGIVGTSYNVATSQYQSAVAKGEIRFRVKAGHYYTLSGYFLDGSQVLYRYEDKGTSYHEECFNPRRYPEELAGLGC